jgi:hypothetical protein
MHVNHSPLPLLVPLGWLSTEAAFLSYGRSRQGLREKNPAGFIMKPHTCSLAQQSGRGGVMWCGVVWCASFQRTQSKSKPIIE